jgi:hypothetical protein
MGTLGTFSVEVSRNAAGEMIVVREDGSLHLAIRAVNIECVMAQGINEDTLVQIRDVSGDTYAINTGDKEDAQHLADEILSALVQLREEKTRYDAQPFFKALVGLISSREHQEIGVKLQEGFIIVFGLDFHRFAKRYVVVQPEPDVHMDEIEARLKMYTDPAFSNYVFCGVVDFKGQIPTEYEAEKTIVQAIAVLEK